LNSCLLWTNPGEALTEFWISFGLQILSPSIRGLKVLAAWTEEFGQRNAEFNSFVPNSFVESVFISCVPCVPWLKKFISVHPFPFVVELNRSASFFRRLVWLKQKRGVKPRDAPAQHLAHAFAVAPPSKGLTHYEQ